MCLATKPGLACTAQEVHFPSAKLFRLSSRVLPTISRHTLELSGRTLLRNQKISQGLKVKTLMWQDGVIRPVFSVHFRIRSMIREHVRLRGLSLIHGGKQA